MAADQDLIKSLSRFVGYINEKDYWGIADLFYEKTKYSVLNRQLCIYQDGYYKAVDKGEKYEDMFRVVFKRWVEHEFNVDLVKTLVSKGMVADMAREFRDISYVEPAKINPKLMYNMVNCMIQVNPSTGEVYTLGDPHHMYVKS